MKTIAFPFTFFLCLYSLIALALPVQINKTIPPVVHARTSPASSAKTAPSWASAGSSIIASKQAIKIWTEQTIKERSDLLDYCCATDVSPDGFLHIAYVEGGTHQLIYQKYDPKTMQSVTTKIAQYVRNTQMSLVYHNGTIFIAFDQADGSISLAIGNSAGEWEFHNEIDNADSVDSLDLAVDDCNAHIAYVLTSEANGRQMKYLQLGLCSVGDNGEILTENSGHIHIFNDSGHKSADFTLNPGMKTSQGRSLEIPVSIDYDYKSKVESVAITLDSSNSPHIVYLDSTNTTASVDELLGETYYHDYQNSSLKHYSKASGTWTTETIDADLGYNVDYIAYPITYPFSIAMDASNHLHVIYKKISSGNSNLEYANNKSGTWSKTALNFDYLDLSTVLDLWEGEQQDLAFQNLSHFVDSSGVVQLGLTFSDRLVYANSSRSSWQSRKLADNTANSNSLTTLFNSHVADFFGEDSAENFYMVYDNGHDLKLETTYAASVASSSTPLKINTGISGSSLGAAGVAAVAETRPSPLTQDKDHDGTLDYLDSDLDGDGTLNYLDDDDDNDGQADSGDADSLLIDVDGDRIPDFLDTDVDNDGEPNTSDAFPYDSSETTDSDGDGIGDNADPDQMDSDGDGIVDSEDPDYMDSDGDGIVDSEDTYDNSSHHGV